VKIEEVLCSRVEDEGGTAACRVDSAGDDAARSIPGQMRMAEGHGCK
jgi:hypothetical protein